MPVAVVLPVCRVKCALGVVIFNNTGFASLKMRFKITLSDDEVRKRADRDREHDRDKTGHL